jgi:hypothetical protein
LPAINGVMRTEVISDKGSLEALAWLKEQRNVLVVAPSLGDNLPYAMIELYTNGIPFVTTRIGGIPDITWRRERGHARDATSTACARPSRHICQEQRLRVDYAHGLQRQDRHEDARRFHRRPAAHPLAPNRRRSGGRYRAGGRDDADGPDAVAACAACAAIACPGLSAVRWLTFAEWRRERPEVPTLFLDTTVIPGAGAARARRARG